MNPNPWRIGPDAAPAAGGGDFKLVAQMMDGAVRFLVRRRFPSPRRHPHVVLASGTEESVRAAMAAAVRMAERLSGAEGGRRITARMAVPPRGPRP